MFIQNVAFDKIYAPGISFFYKSCQSVIIGLVQTYFNVFPSNITSIYLAINTHTQRGIEREIELERERELER